MRPIVRAGLALIAALMLCAAAADPADRLSDPAKEARARALFRDVRCLVCQSESIDESEAPLARDLRQLIRQDIAEGQSEAQIRAYLVSRYGEFVILTPRASLGNAVLWAGPLLVLIAGLAVLVVRRRGAGAKEAPGLTVEEEAALKKLSADELL
jgi:cytochrome c-type biogenesis protein CcmH